MKADIVGKKVDVNGNILYEVRFESQWLPYSDAVAVCGMQKMKRFTEVTSKTSSNSPSSSKNSTKATLIQAVSKKLFTSSPVPKDVPNNKGTHENPVHNERCVPSPIAEDFPTINPDVFNVLKTPLLKQSPRQSQEISSASIVLNSSTKPSGNCPPKASQSICMEVIQTSNALRVTSSNTLPSRQVQALSPTTRPCDNSSSLSKRHKLTSSKSTAIPGSPNKIDHTKSPVNSTQGMSSGKQFKVKSPNKAVCTISTVRNLRSRSIETMSPKKSKPIIDVRFTSSPIQNKTALPNKANNVSGATPTSRKMAQVYKSVVSAPATSKSNFALTDTKVITKSAAASKSVQFPSTSKNGAVVNKPAQPTSSVSVDRKAKSDNIIASINTTTSVIKKTTSPVKIATFVVQTSSVVKKPTSAVKIATSPVKTTRSATETTTCAVKTTASVIKTISAVRITSTVTTSVDITGFSTGMSPSEKDDVISTNCSRTLSPSQTLARSKTKTNNALYEFIQQLKPPDVNLSEETSPRLTKPGGTSLNLKKPAANLSRTSPNSKKPGGKLSGNSPDLKKAGMNVDLSKNSPNFKKPDVNVDLFKKSSNLKNPGVHLSTTFPSLTKPHQFILWSSLTTALQNAVLKANPVNKRAGAPSSVVTSVLSSGTFHVSVHSSLVSNSTTSSPIILTASSTFQKASLPLFVASTTSSLHVPSSSTVAKASSASLVALTTNAATTLVSSPTISKISLSSTTSTKIATTNPLFLSFFSSAPPKTTSVSSTVSSTSIPSMTSPIVAETSSVSSVFSSNIVPKTQSPSAFVPWTAIKTPIPSTALSTKTSLPLHSTSTTTTLTKPLHPTTPSIAATTTVLSNTVAILPPATPIASNSAMETTEVLSTTLSSQQPSLGRYTCSLLNQSRISDVIPPTPPAVGDVKKIRYPPHSQEISPLRILSSNPISPTSSTGTPVKAGGNTISTPESGIMSTGFCSPNLPTLSKMPKEAFDRSFVQSNLLLNSIQKNKQTDLSPLSKTPALTRGLYCRQCDVTFTHLMQFNYHKKTYCKGLFLQTNSPITDFHNPPTGRTVCSHTVDTANGDESVARSCSNNNNNINSKHKSDNKNNETPSKTVDFQVTSPFLGKSILPIPGYDQLLDRCSNEDEEFIQKESPIRHNSSPLLPPQSQLPPSQCSTSNVTCTGRITKKSQYFNDFVLSDKIFDELQQESLQENETTSTQAPSPGNNNTVIEPRTRLPQNISTEKMTTPGNSRAKRKLSDETRKEKSLGVPERGPKEIYKIITTQSGRGTRKSPYLQDFAVSDKSFPELQESLETDDDSKGSVTEDTVRTTAQKAENKTTSIQHSPEIPFTANQFFTNNSNNLTGSNDQSQSPEIPYHAPQKQVYTEETPLPIVSSSRRLTEAGNCGMVVPETPLLGPDVKRRKSNSLSRLLESSVGLVLTTTRRKSKTIMDADDHSKTKLGGRKANNDNVSSNKRQSQPNPTQPAVKKVKKTQQRETNAALLWTRSTTRHGREYKGYIAVDRPYDDNEITSRKRQQNRSKIRRRSRSVCARSEYVSRDEISISKTDLSVCDTSVPGKKMTNESLLAVNKPTKQSNADTEYPTETSNGDTEPTETNFDTETLAIKSSTMNKKCPVGRSNIDIERATTVASNNGTWTEPLVVAKYPIETSNVGVQSLTKTSIVDTEIPIKTLNQTNDSSETSKVPSKIEAEMLHEIKENVTKSSYESRKSSSLISVETTQRTVEISTGVDKSSIKPLHQIECPTLMSVETTQSAIETSTWTANSPTRPLQEPDCSTMISNDGTQNSKSVSNGATENSGTFLIDHDFSAQDNDNFHGNDVENTTVSTNVASQPHALESDNIESIKNNAPNNAGNSKTAQHLTLPDYQRFQEGISTFSLQSRTSSVFDPKSVVAPPCKKRLSDCFEQKNLFDGNVIDSFFDTMSALIESQEGMTSSSCSAPASIQKHPSRHSKSGRVEVNALVSLDVIRKTASEKNLNFNMLIEE